jgi:hypothetical protein
MSRSGESIAADDGLGAALRRFPGQRRQIEDLLRQSESFVGLCADLAAAESALAAVGQLPEAVRAARRAEFQDLVESLGAELGTALRAATVVSISDAKRH